MEKEKLKIWYRDVFSKKHNIHDDYTSIELMPWSFRWGVYLEFFDSVGIEISLGLLHWSGKYSWSIYDRNINVFFSRQFDTRQEAQTEAIKKAFEILNSK
jgi:hypothetical protein